MSDVRYCGMDYGDDEPILEHDDAQVFREARGGCWLPQTFVRWNGDQVPFKSPGTEDDALAQLFEGLFKARQAFIAIGGDWWNADLVRFALERTGSMPDWVRGVPVRIVRQMMTKLEAARRRFIKISHRVQCTGCFGDKSIAIKAIDKYIGKKPARTPDCLDWTPRYGHWSSERVMARRKIRNALADMNGRSLERSAARTRHGHCDFGPLDYWNSHQVNLMYWIPMIQDPTPLPEVEGVALHRSDRGPVDVNARSNGLEAIQGGNLASQPVREADQTPRQDDRGPRRFTWAAASIRNAERRRSPDVTGCKMVTQGRWRLVRQCE
jgi:hypothetical protein